MEECTKVVWILGLWFCASVCSAVSLKDHEFGAGYGWGKPESLRGYRVHYRYHLFTRNFFAIDIEASHGRWKLNSHYGDQVNSTGVAPVFRWMFPPVNEFRFYFEGSVGPSRISTKCLGGKRFGSKWNFQDQMGGGVHYRHWDLRIFYLHYSNAKFAMPNPGIDILPLMTLSYTF